MQKYICTSILIFCTGAALLGLNFVLEKMKTKNLQKEGLNFLQLTMYEFFQYLINIKQMVRNKCSIIDEFLCNKNIENISEVFSNPQLTDECNSNEFVRMYYVACSRAREDLYIHITSGCTKDVIENSLQTYIHNTGCHLEYEFLPL